MRGLKVGVFLDDQKRDHEYTVLSLKNALERSGLVLQCLDVRPDDLAGHDVFREATSSSFAAFEGIALDHEFSDVSGFSSFLYVLDNALNFDRHPWTDRELDEAAALSRVVAFDIRAWSFYRAIFGRNVPLLPAPLPSYGGFSLSQSQRVVVIVNDRTLANHCLGGVLSAIRSVSSVIEVIEIDNTFDAPAPQSAWLNPLLPNARAHVHIGQPPDAISVGRLIDSMNMRAPCIVFDDTFVQRDLGISVPWRTPVYISDVNIVRVSSISAFLSAIKVVLTDQAWSRNLIRAASKEVEEFQKQFVGAFAVPLSRDPMSWRQL